VPPRAVVISAMMYFLKAGLLNVKHSNPVFLILIVLVIATLGACTGSNSETSASPNSGISTSLSPLPSFTATPLPSVTATPPPRSQSDIVAELRSSVVRIETSGVNGDFTGTGLVLSANTNIVATAYHVVDGATEIIVRRADSGDSASLVAELLAFDPITDLALLEVAGQQRRTVN
jgi:S1-C subfamily serine protease